MDKYEVAKTIGEEFNYPWIEEMNCFDGFPEVLKTKMEQMLKDVIGIWAKVKMILEPLLI